jgi:AraC family transcriptional regulator
MNNFGPIRFDHGRPMLLGGLTRYHAFAGSAGSILEQWEQFRALGRIPGQLDAATVYGVMCGHNAGGFEYMCGVEVESLAALPAGLGRMRIPEQSYALFQHLGHISTIRGTWERIMEWLQNSGYQSAQRPDFEIYDRRFDARTGLGGVEIWISITREIH